MRFRLKLNSYPDGLRANAIGKLDFQDMEIVSWEDDKLVTKEAGHEGWAPLGKPHYIPTQQHVFHVIRVRGPEPVIVYVQLRGSVSVRSQVLTKIPDWLYVHRKYHNVTNARKVS